MSGPPSPASTTISIHAPREGSDWNLGSLASFWPTFLSTLPARGATEDWARSHWLTLFLSTLPARGATCGPGPGRSWRSYFYPRSPRGERPAVFPGPCVMPHFYPRSPRGERPIWPGARSAALLFLSTLPARGATNGRERFKFE